MAKGLVNEYCGTRSGINFIIYKLFLSQLNKELNVIMSH